MKVDRFEIARVLRETAALLALEGGNPHRARAYERGAEAIETTTEEFATLLEQDRLTSLPGIGDALAAQIAELASTGASSLHARLTKIFPPGVLELSRVPGMTLARIRTLHEALGIDSIDALESACRAGHVRKLPRFGEKTEAKLLAGIERARNAEERVLLVEAAPFAQTLLRWVRAQPEVQRVDLAGELRRMQESTTTVELVVTTTGPLAFERAPAVVEVREEGERRIVARLANGMTAIVHLVRDERDHARALLVHTGPPAHVAALEARDPRGATEEELYASVGLSFVPPELREDPEAFARAAGPIALIEESDVRGLVHCHTDWSDGISSLEEMAREADALGAEYLTITDHSAAAHYAGGLDVERLKRQWDAIAEVQEKVSVRLLRGTECDILGDGALDWPDAILEQLDVVIASVHSQFKLDEDTMTRRLVRAMKHPVFKIWGHALGRLIERRAPYAVRVPEVLDAVAEGRAAIEINGDPYRLDLPPEWIRQARKRRLPFVVSTDAHSTRALRNVHFGVAMARRGGLEARDVLNTRGARAFADAVKPVRVVTQ